MKLIDDILFSQHYELKKKGKPVGSAKNTGLLLCSVLVVLLLLDLAFLLYVTGILKVASIGGLSGRSTGRLLAIPVVAIVFYFLYKVAGNQEKYEAMVARNEALSSEAQEVLYHSAMKRFLSIFGTLFGILLLEMFFSW